MYANPPWTLIGKVLANIAKEGSRVLLVTPYWKGAPWYGLLLELTVRSYEWRGKLYLTEAGNLRPIPKWFTLFSYVVVERRDLTDVELAIEIAVEPGGKNEKLAKESERLCVDILFRLLSGAYTTRTGDGA